MVDADPWLLVFHRRGRDLAFRAEQVAEVLPNRQPQPVPLAPAAVAGLILERGRVLTVVELDRLLRISGDDPPVSYLVLLAPPHAHLAVRINSELRFAREGDLDHGPEVLDTDRVVSTLETLMSNPGKA